MEEKTCKFGDSVISYLYNEMPSSERDRFEQHMLDCSSCTDEFAGVAFSRFEVYEWTKEFAQIPTPRFAIPYDEPVTLVERVRRAFQKGFSWPAATGAAFASLAVIVGLVYFTLLPDRTDIAAVEPVVERSVVVPSVPLSQPDSASMAEVIVEPKASARRSIPVVAKGTRSGAKRTPDTVPQQRFATNAARDVSSPRLTEFADDSDDSLRLAELFDEIGSSE